MLIWGGKEAALDGSSQAAVGGAAYDPVTDAWRPIQDPRAEQFTREAVAWTGSELFVWGGDNDGGWGHEGFLYDPGSDTTRLVADAPAGTAAVRADAVAIDGTVVITSGYTNFPEAHPVRYEVATDSWQRVSAQPPLTGEASAPLFGYAGRAYFCGILGLLCSVYAAKDDSWSELDLARGRGASSEWRAWVLTDHELVFAGSVDEAGKQPIATRFDLDAREWSVMPTDGIPEPRRGRSATWVDDGVLFWGGASASGERVAPEEGWLLKLR